MYSYAPNFTTFNADQVNWDSQDAMLVSISDDCGKTWKQLNTGDYIGGNARTPNNPPTKVNPLRTTNTALPSNVDYAPINASQWKEFKLTNAGIKKANVRFRVTFMAAGGNNFFLDKMQVVYNTGINELTAEDLRFSVQPNPFSGSTKIAYTLPSNNHVTIKLVDLLGKEVTTVFEGKQSEGEQEVTMDCTKSNIKPGIYFVSFSAGNTALFTKKVIIN
jgi:hypothetical protein